MRATLSPAARRLLGSLYHRGYVAPVASALAKRGEVLRRSELRATAVGGALWTDPPIEDLDALNGPVPIANDPGASRIEQDIQPYEFEAPFVGELRGSYLVGPGPLGLTADGRRIADAIVWTERSNARIERAVEGLVAVHGAIGAARLLAADEANRRRRVDWELETACLLSNAWVNYHHWLLEHVLKLRALEALGERHHGRILLVVPPGPPAFVGETLELLGYGPGRWVAWRPDAVARVERLLVPAYPEPLPSSCRWLRERILAGAPETAATPSRIYVARPRAAQRRVVNEPELISALAGSGYRAVTLEDLSVGEQARLFEGASVIVAPHGAGLTNLVFSRRASVLELFGRHVRPHYFRLAKLMGLSYRGIAARPVGDHLEVDVDLVSRTAAELSGGS